MGFYSLKKWFQSWRLKPFYDWIYWYNEYVLKTPEQREKEKTEQKKKMRESLVSLTCILSVLDKK